GFHPLGHPFGPQPICRPPPRGLHHFVSDPTKEQGIGLGEFLGPETMQFFVRGTFTIIDAAVQRDVDGVPKGSHDVNVPPIRGSGRLNLRTDTPRSGPRSAPRLSAGCRRTRRAAASPADPAPGGSARPGRRLAQPIPAGSDRRPPPGRPTLPPRPRREATPAPPPA